MSEKVQEFATKKSLLMKQAFSTFRSIASSLKVREFSLAGRMLTLLSC